MLHLEFKPKKNYISSIDGLRGFAVILVILYHSFQDYFPGGFVGVDIFFVISGFVITKKISEEIGKSEFNIVKFYCDRIKRLIPMFVLVVFLTSAVAMLLLTPQELLNYSKSLISASTFVSNFYYWRTLDYFDAGKTSDLLLHTWSLSLEWQFYIIFPLVFYILYRIARNSITPLLLAAVTLSVALSEITIYNHSAFSFYMLPTRMFELLVGSIIAVFYEKELDFKTSKRSRNILISVSLWVGISGLVFQVNTNALGSPFPGLNALWVVLLFSAVFISLLSQDTLGVKLFTIAPLKHLGFISYGMYLWHYPILELAKKIYSDRLDEIVFWISYTVVLLLVAECSGRLVERPIWRMKTSVKTTLAFVGFGFISAFAFYALIQETNGFQSYFFRHLNKQEQANFLAISRFATANHLKIPVVGSCRELSEFSHEFSKKILDCARNRPTILVIGDSHAINLYNGLARSPELNNKYNILAIASGGCALGNTFRHCDISVIHDFLTKNSDQFYRILYIEAGFRQFKTEHAQQSERRDFTSSFSVANLDIDEDKITRIADWLMDIRVGEKLLWIGPWTEPQLYLNDIKAVRNLTEMDNRKTFRLYEKLSSVYAQIVSHYKGQFKYIELLPMFSALESHVYIDGCLRFSDNDHLSTCGEDYLAQQVIAKSMGF